MPEPTIAIAARHRATRDAIRAAVSAADVFVVGEACHRWDAGELVRGFRPDAVVVGVDLLATREFFLTGWGPVSRATRIVAIGPDDPHLARMLLAHGAAAYVPAVRLSEELPDRLAEVVGLQGASRNGGYSSVTSANA